MKTYAAVVSSLSASPLIWWSIRSRRRGSRIVAVCRTHCVSPMGPCTKQPLPFLTTSTDGVGPGGLAVFNANDGRAYVAFHSWVGRVGYPEGVRALNIRQLSINGS